MERNPSTPRRLQQLAGSMSPSWFPISEADYSRLPVLECKHSNSKRKKYVQKWRNLVKKVLVSKKIKGAVYCPKRATCYYDPESYAQNFSDCVWNEEQTCSLPYRSPRSAYGQA